MTYDDCKSASLKTDWINEQGLGGAMYWELSGDKTDREAIVPLVASRFNKLDSRLNHLDYSKSRFDNMRKGMA